ncbi:M36 family metallopeptidase [Haloarcula salinisoli]|uniref:M36 family metallopeptidase n=1 Tax=Haloarcula salinisoli TaxID=2487746 RepID=A0A8J8C8A8_9EURY|nr:M36 family metallopeptidase [Halomicroarcula salinisoli]MBX0302954.1 M36 family metallopeptidase [Halomicroarcula salinisoli]
MILRELDQRKQREVTETETREQRLQERATAVSDDSLPEDHRIEIDRFDSTSGTAAEVTSSDAPSADGDYVDRAVAHIKQISPALGLVDEPDQQPVEYLADSGYQRTTSNGVAVKLQPAYRGRKIFEANQTVQFAPDGRIQKVVNRGVPLPKLDDSEPTIRAEEAVMQAAEYAATQQPETEEMTDQFGEPLEQVPIDLEGFEPTVLATFPDIHERPTVLAAGPFGAPFKARQIWFPLSPEDVRLAWDIELTMPDGFQRYLVMVDAADGSVLYVRPLTQHTAARGNVCPEDGSDQREMRPFPQSADAYPVGATDGSDELTFPEWVDDDATEGINAVVRPQRNPEWVFGALGSPYEGEFDGDTVVFDPVAERGEEQGLLNAFYFTNVMHDVFYLLGFQEDDGNFQRRNFDRGGNPSDAVDVRYVPGAVQGVATMGTPVDGQQPRMNLGLVRRTGRHTALDSSVVYHEYAHGVTNRLVGGPMNSRALLEPQSRGQGEGWSDYVACSINDSVVVGDWVVDDPSGIRRHPYDESFPDGFDDLGTEPYTGPHAIGTVWCAALMKLNREIGVADAMQLVVDALKLTPSNPSMLDSRDAILSEVANKRQSGQYDQKRADAVEVAVWRSFATYGMGPDATCLGPSLEGIEADYSVEPGRQPTPEAEPAESETATDEPTGGPVATGANVPQNVVGMTPTPSGGGFYLVDSDGTVYAFGDAQFHGSLDEQVDSPVVDIEATTSGEGYWLVLGDGGVRAFGDAPDFEAPTPAGVSD